MTADQYKMVVEFEEGLVVGSPVAIRFTNVVHYRGVGVIVKINAKSFRVQLTAEVPNRLGGDPYRVGRELLAPRIDDICKWTANNRVEPVAGYEESTAA